MRSVDREKLRGKIRLRRVFLLACVITDYVTLCTVCADHTFVGIIYLPFILYYSFIYYVIIFVNIFYRPSPYFSVSIAVTNIILYPRAIKSLLYAPSPARDFRALKANSSLPRHLPFSTHVPRPTSISSALGPDVPSTFFSFAVCYRCRRAFQE